MALVHLAAHVASLTVANSSFIIELHRFVISLDSYGLENLLHGAIREMQLKWSWKFVWDAFAIKILFQLF
jgi:hypothetical protein